MAREGDSLTVISVGSFLPAFSEHTFRAGNRRINEIDKLLFTSLLQLPLLYEVYAGLQYSLMIHVIRFHRVIEHSFLHAEAFLL